MNISYKQPADRGVTTLMYVGDDDAVEKAVKASGLPEASFGILAALIALQTKGLTRLAAAGVAAFIGYRAYKARK
jgi:hypothetical protein